jgi:hypothetical protein
LEELKQFRREYDLQKVKDRTPQASQNVKTSLTVIDTVGQLKCVTDQPLEINRIPQAHQTAYVQKKVSPLQPPTKKKTRIKSSQVPNFGRDHWTQQHLQANESISYKSPTKQQWTLTSEHQRQSPFPQHFNFQSQSVPRLANLVPTITVSDKDNSTVEQDQRQH